MSRQTEVRGYLRGLEKAAQYLGINRGTLRDWVHEFGLRPRVIHGQAYFKITTLDRFMDPDSNAPGAESTIWREPASPPTS